MQRAVAVLCLLGGLQAACASLAAGSAVSTQAPSTSPVTRIVELLKMLQMQCEADAKTEEVLYEKFVCWGKEVIKQKEGTNAVSKQEVAELTQYIEDLNSGRIELTSERVDLEKEISELFTSIETLDAQHKKDTTDFENADAEMNQAIDALTEAADVLKTATDGHETGVFAEIKVQSGHRAEAEAKQAALLEHATELGDRFLDKGDAVFLRRLLTGEVPTSDWKKLNRKATFKMSYKARSFKIQDVIAKLLETFTINQKDLTAKNEQAYNTYKEETDLLKTQLDSAKEALNKMGKENGEKSLSRTEAQDRIDLLNEQIAADESYIVQVEGELDYKKKDWAERSRIRLGEIQAISKAIEILHNDDARDLFKKSFKSQGYFFLQTGQHSSNHEALDVLRSVARQTSDERVTAIVRAMELAPAFGAELAKEFEPIIDKIDVLVGIIEAEEESDKTKKETCETTRADTTRNAITMSRDIDVETDTMTSMDSKIEKLEQQIAENDEVMEVLNKQKTEEEGRRAEEEQAYLKAKADDEEAAKTVEQAAAVLVKFYSDEGLGAVGLLQHRARAPVVVAAGKAPPPPPATWEDPYAGKTGESTGVVAILRMIKEDIERDISKATEADTKSQEASTKLLTALATEMASRMQLDSELKSAKVTAEDKRLNAMVTRKSLKDMLTQELASIKKMEPDCNYFTINFPVRQKNRQTEIDGLLKAKAILLGADFDPKKEQEASKWKDVPKILRPKEFQLPQLGNRLAPAGRHLQ